MKKVIALTFVTFVSSMTVANAKSSDAEHHVAEATVCVKQADKLVESFEKYIRAQAKGKEHKSHKDGIDLAAALDNQFLACRSEILSAEVALKTEGDDVREKYLEQTKEATEDLKALMERRSKVVQQQLEAIKGKKK